MIGIARTVYCVQYNVISATEGEHFSLILTRMDCESNDSLQKMLYLTEQNPDRFYNVL